MMMHVITEASSDMSVTEVVEDEYVLHIDPALCNAEDTARIVAERAANGKPTVVVLGNVGRTEQLLLERLEAEEGIERDYFGQPRAKRIGIVAGQIHAISTGMALSTGPGYPMSFYAEPVTYFDYRQHLRDVEVDRQTRRPPKKATCSARRRGRKFKG